jgi:hypothetical protein
MDASGPERVQGLEHAVDSPHEPKYIVTASSNARSPLADKQEEGYSAALKGKSGKIGGLRPWVFWVLILVAGVVIVGASIGGAVGGTRAAQRSGTSTTPLCLQRWWLREALRPPWRPPRTSWTCPGSSQEGPQWVLGGAKPVLGTP